MKKHVLAAVSLLVLATACCLPGNNSTEPLSAALDALDNDTGVRVSKTEGAQPECDYYYTFRPAGDTPTRAFIFYPGGLVRPEAYAVHLSGIAAQGYLVFLMKVPMDLAIFCVDCADKILADGSYAGIEKWAIGGHSFGGVAAAMYTEQHPEKIDGLIFWASYPASDISTIDQKVISIYGTLDGLTDATDIAESETNLPEDTQWVPIEGGNHTQFGYYGDDNNPDFLQEDDNPAEISRDNQTGQIVEATADFLQNL